MISAKFRFDCMKEDGFSITVTLEANDYQSLISSTLHNNIVGFEFEMRKKYPKEELEFDYWIESPLSMGHWEPIETITYLKSWNGNNKK